MSPVLPRLFYVPVLFGYPSSSPGKFSLIISTSSSSLLVVKAYRIVGLY